MEPNNADRPSTPERGGLDSKEQRSRLLTKLNCLIAVLEVAIAKIGRNLQAPEANADRLRRVRTNLENTLAICVRAKRTLALGMGGDAAAALADEDPLDVRQRMGYRDYVELGSIEEYRKFKELPPISNDELESTNLDDLLNKLGGL